MIDRTEIQPTKAISGSLIAAIAGFNPWSDAVYAYNAIFGLADEESSSAASWGEKLEPLLAREYAEEHRALLWPHTDFGLDHRRSYLMHPQHNWASGTPDRLVISDPKWIIPLELHLQDPEAAQELARQQVQDGNFWDQVKWGWEGKTAGPRMVHLWGEEDTDDIPPLYLCQVAWYMGLTSLPRWDLSVLLGGQYFRTYYLQRVPELEQMLYQVGHDFWHNHILVRTPPPRDASPAWKNYFKRWFPQETEPLKPAAREDEALMLRLWQVAQQLKELEAEDETLRNELRMVIGDHAGIEGVYQGMPWKITWKKNKDGKKTDWEKLCNKIVELHKDYLMKMEGPKAFAKFVEVTYPPYLAECTSSIEGARVFRPSFPKHPTEKGKKK
ncbi:MAG: YqaJ viral recombinase family protein [Thermodesulfobacteriota bacterium]